MTKIGLSRHNRGHFGGGLHSQSLDCYWRTNSNEKTQYKSQKYTHKHNTDKDGITYDDDYGYNNRNDDESSGWSIPTDTLRFAKPEW